MFGKRYESSQIADAPRPPASRRHGRRPIRSAITGPGLLDPNGSVLTFKRWAGAAIQYLQAHLPEELDGVNLGFATMPIYPQPKRSVSTKPMYYDIDRENKTIVLYRMPIQRFRGLHANDEDHRRMFVEHCVYYAVCEYLDVNPWDLFPGRFEHY